MSNIVHGNGDWHWQKQETAQHNTAYRDTQRVKQQIPAADGDFSPTISVTYSEYNLFCFFFFLISVGKIASKNLVSWITAQRNVIYTQTPKAHYMPWHWEWKHSLLDCTCIAKSNLEVFTKVDIDEWTLL